LTKTESIDSPWEYLVSHVIDVISRETSLDSDVIQDTVEIPPDPKLGDVATTVAFHLAKQQKRNPVEIANELLEKLASISDDDPIINNVTTKGPYINIFLDRGAVAKTTLDIIATKGTDFGRSDSYTGKRVMIESPAVNPSKPWHIGHARNAVIGDTLANVLETVGYDVVRLDYINDLGLQIAQLVWRLLKGKDKYDEKQKYDHFLGHLYVDVQKELEDPQVEAEIREVSRGLEILDSEAAIKSSEMVSRCVLAQYQTAHRLGIYKTLQTWESAIAHSGLLETGRKLMMESDNVFILEEGEKKGCVVADLRSIPEFEDMRDPYKVLFRSDGTRTYTGADVAFQMWKFGVVDDPFLYSEFTTQPNGVKIIRTSTKGSKHDIGKMDLVFNVIGSEQAHPQKLIYYLLNLLGYEKQSESSHHIAFEFVGLEGADFSGREGTWIGYSCDTVLDRAAELAREEVEKRNPNESDEFKDRVAEQIGSGAVRYFLLNASPDRKMTFTWEKVLDFNGDAAPYLQYSGARARRILEKAEASKDSVDTTLLVNDAEYKLIKALALFPSVVLEVANGLKKETSGTKFATNRLTSFTYEIATLFSRFYDTSPVLKADQALRAARLELVKSFSMTMANCLRLLGIPVVERM
jgi:arginyl-tRNA synthetase